MFQINISLATFCSFFTTCQVRVTPAGHPGFSSNETDAYRPSSARSAAGRPVGGQGGRRNGDVCVSAVGIA